MNIFENINNHLKIYEFNAIYKIVFFNIWERIDSKAIESQKNSCLPKLGKLNNVANSFKDYFFEASGDISLLYSEDTQKARHAFDELFQRIDHFIGSGRRFIFLDLLLTGKDKNQLERGDITLSMELYNKFSPNCQLYTNTAEWKYIELWSRIYKDKFGVSDLDIRNRTDIDSKRYPCHGFLNRIAKRISLLMDTAT